MTSKIRTFALLAVAAVGSAACDWTPESGTVEAVYARAAESLEVRTLEWGETLGEVLYASLPDRDAGALVMAFKEQARPAELRAGTEIAFRYVGDQYLRGVDVPLSRDETVRITRLGEAWFSERVATPLYTDTVLVAGEVTASLWESVISSESLEGLPYDDRAEMVTYLDRVFQWQLDFSRQVQRGDYFRVAFERDMRTDGSMKGARVLAAEFVNVGRPYHAIWFDPNGDGQGSHFDLDGKSVRRSFLLKPLEFRRISSRYSSGRFHPILQRWRAHRGVDYAADQGTEIMATADGVVIHRGPNGGLGNAVEIRHPNGFVTRYGHLSRFKSGVSVGSRVKQGEIIGYVGSTGLATGPHLHYEMLRNGRHVDPLAVDLPAGDPVPADDLERWQVEMTPRLALLDLLPPAGLARFADAAEPAARPGVAEGSDR